MENRKGLSEIVATLIIILLTLVAVGIIWVVIRNVIQGGTETVDLNSKCLAVSIQAVGVEETGDATGIYSVTLKRNAGGDNIEGVKIVVFNGSDSSSTLDFGIALKSLETKTNSSINANLIDGNKIEYTPFFVDSSGNEQPCPQATQTFNF